MAKTYFMILYDEDRPKGASMAMHKVLSKDDASVLLQDAAATIDIPRGKYKVTSKRLFNFDYIGEKGEKKEMLFIIVDAKKVSG